MAKKSKTFFSNAEWTKIKKSYDSHRDFESAKAICIALYKNYRYEECEIRGNCTKSFVTNESGFVLFEYPVNRV